MQKEIFIELMEELVAIRKDEDTLNAAFKKFEPEFNNISFSRYESIVVKSLEEAMNDTDCWISYWLYECDLGRKKDLLNNVTYNGKKISIRTLGNLYDGIIKMV